MIATVKGDLHDVGKKHGLHDDAPAAALKVVDLGVDVPLGQVIRGHRAGKSPAIIGLSALFDQHPCPA